MSVDLVGGHPGKRQAGLPGASDHLLGEFGVGGKYPDLAVLDAPGGAGVLPLHPFGTGIPGLFGQLPTGLAFDRRYQPGHQRSGRAPSSHSAKTPGHSVHHRLEYRATAGRGYRVAHGHHVLMRRHTLVITRWQPPSHHPSHQQDHKVTLEY
nr:hypothetical protein [Actinopolyspora righensis]